MFESQVEDVLQREFDMELLAPASQVFPGWPYPVQPDSADVAFLHGVRPVYERIARSVIGHATPGPLASRRWVLCHRLCSHQLYQ